MERQTILKEIATNKNLQAIIDNSLEMYRPIIWPNFFEWKDTNSLKWETIIGDSGPGAAATVVSYNSSAPLRTRKAVKKLSGDIPSMREKFVMSETDLLTYINLLKMGESDSLQVLKMIMDDVRNAGEAPHKRLDIFTLEMISTGKLTLNKTNNPDGIIWETDVDFGMPAANKIGVTAKWSDATNSKPITDIETICEKARAKGIYFPKMYMHRTVWNNFRKSKEVIDYITGWAVGKETSRVNINLELANQFLSGEKLPQIVIVDASIGIEKNGIVTNINPFSETNVAFLPDQKLGDMYNGIIVEREFPVSHVTYAEYNRVLIKKWGETDPVTEFTGCELNAFPSWKNVNNCYLMNTDNVNTFE